MWCCVTCVISCASTDASSDSVCVSRIEPDVDADVAAGQRERVDRRIGDREELEVLAAVGHGGDEPMAELVQVVVDLGVVEIGARAADLPHDALAELAFLRRREHRLRFVAEVGQLLRLRDAGPERGGAERLHGQGRCHERGGQASSHAVGGAVPVQVERTVRKGSLSVTGRCRCQC